MIQYNRTIETLKQNLEDERGKKVLFVSHCLLNENTRYMGGAFCPGANPEILAQLARLDAGIVQTMCPERIAWGGLYKKHIYGLAGIGKTPGLDVATRLLFPVGYPLLNFRMRWVARHTALEIRDYIQNNMRVLGYVGVGSSPSCGVEHTIDVKEFFKWFSKADPSQITRKEQNNKLMQTTIAGPGIFISLLKKHLARENISIPFFEYSLADEMNGKRRFILEVS